MIKNILAGMAVCMQNNLIDKIQEIDYLSNDDMVELERLDGIITSLGFSVEDFPNPRTIEVNSFVGRVLIHA